MSDRCWPCLSQVLQAITRKLRAEVVFSIALSPVVSPLISDIRSFFCFVFFLQLPQRPQTAPRHQKSTLLSPSTDREVILSLEWDRKPQSSFLPSKTTARGSSHETLFKTVYLWLPFVLNSLCQAHHSPSVPSPPWPASQPVLAAQQCHSHCQLQAAESAALEWGLMYKGWNAEDELSVALTFSVSSTNRGFLRWDRSHSAGKRKKKVCWTAAGNVSSKLPCTTSAAAPEKGEDYCMILIIPSSRPSSFTKGMKSLHFPFTNKGQNLIESRGVYAS